MLRFENDSKFLSNPALMVFYKLNLPQQKPNYGNDKNEVAIQLPYHQVAAEKWLKTSLKLSPNF